MENSSLSLQFLFRMLFLLKINNSKGIISGMQGPVLL